MSAYSVYCGCGRSHRVSATQAGSTLDCSCGNTVAIPRLSALRKAVGEEAVPLNTVERIEMMIRNADLPTGDLCPLSGRPADDTMHFCVQCERVWVRGGESIDAVAYVLLGWIGGLIALILKSQRPELHGRETYLIVPVRVSSEVRLRIAGIRRQKSLKALLSQTPIYSQLLKEYPTATVSPIKATRGNLSATMRGQRDTTST